ncbi:hypothetical protein GMMP15_1440001 [Candidatus Magnetomoraceae bacterium gMMP-15]
MYKKQILVVDDEQDIAELIKYNLEKDNYNVITANSGEEVFDIVKYNIPELILLDIMLPNINGFEIASCLQEDSVFCDIPIIFLSAKDDTESVVKGLQLGGSDYIKKPFELKELSTRINMHLKLKEAHDKLIRSEQNLCEANKAKDKFFSIIAHDLQ